MALAEIQRKGASVSLINLSKHFGKVKAVDSINLRIRSGEFLTLLGPSGSGKTTVLNMIAGFIQPTGGEIEINNNPVTGLPPYRRDIGMTFQNYALFPHMTIFRNIAFPLKMRKIPNEEIKKKVESALELVRLSEYGNRHPRQLSGGQQQRVALARSLIFNPSVLLMHEPLGALDRKLREHMHLEIKHIQEELGITVIYVTHDQEEALTMSDSIAVMNFGKIVQVGSPSQLYEYPVNRFVADFIGKSNFIRGTYQRVDGESNGIMVVENSTFSVPLREIAQGAKIELVIRPEKVVFLESSEAEKGTNFVKGTIEEVMYIGEATVYNIITDLNQRFVVKHPNRAGTSIRKKGDHLLIGWRVEDSILFEDQD